jgi:DNA invertase Pin-like site-specific DNA recombinase
MPVCRGYGRRSDDKQVMSLEQQESVIKEAYALFQKVRPGWGDYEWGGFFADDVVSRDSKFHQRETGSLLLAATQAGDAIIVANYDRIFANVIDVCETLQFMQERQFKLCVLDMDIDLSSVMGPSLYKLLAVIKEMEVNEIRRRSREAAAHRRKIGRPVAGANPVGWKSVGGLHPTGKDYHYLYPDEEQRVYARHLYALKKRFPTRSLRALARLLNQRGDKHPSGRNWNAMSLRRWLNAVEQDFPLHNGSHEAAPMPADCVPVERVLRNDD